MARLPGPALLTRPRTGWTALAVVGAFLLVYPRVGGEFQVFVVTTLFITGILAISLNLAMGYAGLPSFVTTGLYALGAYVSAVLSLKFGWPVPAAMVTGVVATTVAGAIIAAASLRASYLYFGMATLAFDLVIVAIAFQWEPITGGETGLAGLPRLRLGDLIFRTPEFYYLAYAAFALVLLGTWNLVRSEFGRRILAVAQSADAAASLGIPPAATRLLAFAIASAMAGVAGVLFAHLNLFVSPLIGEFEGMLTLFIALFLGGSGTIVGPVIGAAIAGLLQVNLASLGERQVLVFSVVLFLIVVAFPDGIVGRWEKFVGSRRDFRGGSTEHARVPLRPPALASSWSSSTVLEVRGLRRRFGGVVAVDGVDLTVERGTIHGLIGPNGSGKSTTVDLIVGRLRPDAGTIRYLGQPPGRPHEAARRGLIRVFQVPHVFARMTVLDNVRTGLSRHARESLASAVLRTPGLRDEEHRLSRTARDLLRAGGLGHTADWGAAVLSHGQKRLLEVIRAVAADPVLLVLDEPATGLTGSEVTDLAALLRELKASGVAILLIEHNLPFVLGVSDYITALDQGQVIASGLPVDVRRSERLQSAYMGWTPSAREELP